MFICWNPSHVRDTRVREAQRHRFEMLGQGDVCMIDCICTFFVLSNGGIFYPGNEA